MDFKALIKAANSEARDASRARSTLLDALAEKLNLGTSDRQEFDRSILAVADVRNVRLLCKWGACPILLWAHPDPPQPSEHQTLEEVLKQLAGLADGPAIVLNLSDSAQLEQRLLQSQFPQAVLRSEEALSILTGPSAVAPLNRALCAQLPPEGIIPYDPTRRATGAMFVGRASECRTIASMDATSLALVGPKRIGKSSLLKKCCDEINERHPSDLRSWRRAYLFVCHTWSDPARAVRLLAEEIDPHYFARFPSLDQMPFFLAWARKRAHGCVTLLFDEVDSLLAGDAAHGWPFLRGLAAAAERQDIRVVLCGHDVLRSQLISPEFPLAARMAQMTLGPLSPSEGRALVKDPIRDLGVQIEEQDTFAKVIVDRSGGLPGLIHHYCRQLAALALATRGWSLSVRDVENLEQQWGFARLTLDPLFQASQAARLMALHVIRAYPRELTLKELEELVCSVGRGPSQSAFDAALNELVSLSILSVRGGQATCRAPALASQVTSRFDITALIDQCRAEAGSKHV